MDSVFDLMFHQLVVVQVIFFTLGLSYYKVCRQLRGHQYGSSDAFNYLSAGIDSYYVDGVSIT